jgi:hypothetical protein
MRLVAGAAAYLHQRRREKDKTQLQAKNTLHSPKD